MPPPIPSPSAHPDGAGARNRRLLDDRRSVWIAVAAVSVGSRRPLTRRAAPRERPSALIERRSLTRRRIIARRRLPDRRQRSPVVVAVPYIKLWSPFRPGHPATEAHQSPVRIGREPGSTILFSGDAQGRLDAPCRNPVRGRWWVVADLGSRNGTYLNGPPARCATPLKRATSSAGGVGAELRIAAVAAEPEAGRHWRSTP